LNNHNKEDAMGLKRSLETKNGAILTTIFLTVIVLLESIFPPWAPYFVAYAVLAIAIPLWLKTPRWDWKNVFREYWKATIVFFLALLVWEVAISNLLYEWLLTINGKGGDAFWSVGLAIDEVAQGAASKFGIEKDSALLLYGAFFLLWAPIGEEMFYRGYLQEILRRDERGCASLFVPAAFFGIRHATHFFFLWPEVSYGAALVWTIGAFVGGIIIALLYEGTRSIWPPVLVHFSVNLISFIP
jgi:membrane protease YdiL (CAAX protease family)